jgi:MFS family permease
MYSIDWTAILGRSRKKTAAGTSAADFDARPWLERISPTVWSLGFTSLLTDVSSEAVASVLPMYLVLQLGISPVAFGLIDGLYQGMAALVRILGGVLADRSRRYKGLAALGYGASAACRLLIIAAGAAWTTIAGVVAIDRIGKGLRTAPRDALISLRSRSEDLGTAFGVHRALDAAGAFIGPVVAFLLLARMQGAFDVLFVVSFVVAVLGLAVILIFVQPTTTAELAAVERQHAGRSGASAWTVMRHPRLRALTVSAFLLGLPTISDSFLFLALQSNLRSAATAFPLFYVGTSISTALFAAPAGRVADVLGRSRVLLVGYVFLAVAYIVTFMAGSPGGAIICLLFLGAYYAGTDGVLTAMAAAELPARARGTGLAILATVTNVARLLASVIFGALWGAIGMSQTTGIYFAALLAAIVAASVILTTAWRHVPPAETLDLAR